MSTITTPPTAVHAAPPVSSVGTPPSASAKIHVPIVIDSDIQIPGWVVDHESYRRWAKSDEFPERGRFSFLDGMIWVDLTMEDFFAHNQVKGGYSDVLGPLVRAADRGYFGYDGNLWTHLEAGISTEPDGLFFTYETLQSGRIRLIDGKKGKAIELEGTPNMLLEIVSDSSVKKDTLVLKEKCAKAGVDEYWLVDAHGPELRFEIWRLQGGEYVAAADDGGWLSSAVFGRAFKLEQGKDRLGHPRFQLLVR
jgi:Uma2 family endonuclease